MKALSSSILMSVLMLGLTACGSESPEPVEQIVVREPDQVAIPMATDDAEGSSDLVAAGRAAFAACVACHTNKAGEASSVGPNLHGVVGRAAGALEGFSYSEALTGSGLTWDAEELDAFLMDPSAKVPGTTMSAGSVGDSEKRAALIAYLASLSE